MGKRFSMGASCCRIQELFSLLLLYSRQKSSFLSRYEWNLYSPKPCIVGIMMIRLQITMSLAPLGKELSFWLN